MLLGARSAAEIEDAAAMLRTSVPAGRSTGCAASLTSRWTPSARGGCSSGSDWHVCTRAAEYATVVATAGELVAGRSEDEREAVIGGNAARVYGL